MGEKRTYEERRVDFSSVNRKHGKNASRVNWPTCPVRTRSDAQIEVLHLIKWEYEAQ